MTVHVAFSFSESRFDHLLHDVLFLWCLDGCFLVLSAFVIVLVFGHGFLLVETALSLLCSHSLSRGILCRVRLP